MKSYKSALTKESMYDEHSQEAHCSLSGLGLSLSNQLESVYSTIVGLEGAFPLYTMSREKSMDVIGL